MSQTLFTHATLIDGTGQIRPNMSVLVEAERITAVAPSAELPPPTPETRVYDLAGRTLMPGLFQCHMHAAMDGIMSYRELDMKYPATYLTLVAARNMQRMLEFGFTTAVGAGGPANIDVTLKHAIGAGLFTGPRIFACGAHIVTTGESLDYMPSFWKSGLRDGFGRVCDGADAFRHAVRSEIKDGVDVVKVHVSGGHGSNLPADCMAITYDELRAAVDAAHERGKKIRAHVASKAGILMAVRAGVDLIDHADFFDDECIEAFLKNGTSIAAGVLTALGVVRSLAQSRQRAASGEPRSVDRLSSPFFNGINMDEEEFQAELDNLRTYLPRAQAAGVNIINGDDFGGVNRPHGTYADELVNYVETVGIAPIDVLTWATANSARFLGTDDLGGIAPGKLADMLVVDGNPAEDITLLRTPGRLLAVMKGGDFVHSALEAGAVPAGDSGRLRFA